MKKTLKYLIIIDIIAEKGDRMMKNDLPLTPKFPKLLHGGDYNPDQWLKYPDILEKDIQLMKQANINCVSMGIFSWINLEPEEGVYTFDWLTKIIDNLYANGIYTVLATPSGARPAWMAQKYPEVMRVNQDGVRLKFGGRHNHCYSSPIYREKVRQIDTRLAKQYAGHPGVILWHISNEFSGECYCPLCQEAFREWLKKKYGTLENLNDTWWTNFWSHRYTDWEQIQPPQPTGEQDIHGLSLDWKRFATDRTLDFFKMEKEAVHSANPEIPVTTNLMEFGEGLNYFKFKNDLDVVSWDSYPLWHNSLQSDARTAADTALTHDLMRSLLHRPFLLMESTPSTTNWLDISKLKRPGMHMLSSMQAVALGSNSVQYFQWRKGRGCSEKFHGAVVDHYGGSDTRVFRDVAQVGDRLKKLDENTDLYNTCVSPECALIFDWENRWAVEDARGPRNRGIKYNETVLSFHRSFWDLGIPVDIADMECDFSRYKLVVAPMLYLYRADIQKKLADFVRNGGTLVGTYWSGIVDENDLCFLGGTPGGLMDVFGIRSEEIDALCDGEHNRLMMCGNVPEGMKKEYSISDLCDLIHCSSAKPLAEYGDDFYKGRPALTVNSYGKGRAYYLAARTEDPFNRDLIAALAKQAGVQKSLDTCLPDGVTASRRSGKHDYIFVENFNSVPVKVQLPGTFRDAESGESLSAELTLEGYGVRILTEA
jgi:beta-galactosidase